ncbi:MAG: ccmA [Devosia sp.]|nr:ccmA [Devosia sp.]
MSPRQVFPALSLHAQALQCGRGGTVLGRPVDLAVAPGTALLLRGPNGAGKTTLLLTLAGVVEPLEGNFALRGWDPDEGPVLHFCGHRNAVKPRLSVRENLQFWAQVNGGGGLAVPQALEQVGLDMLANLDAGYLSAGQGRRLALARLLVSPRPLWLLDEPTAALDRDGHALVGRLIDGQLDAGGLVIAATHDAIALAGPGRATTLTLERAP